jgi:2-keto-myo-inositol isomerase
VTDSGVAVGEMRDSHRVLVDAGDRIDNLGQIAALRAGGYVRPFSFEPFAPSVHELADPARALSESMAFIREGLVRPGRHLARPA